MKLNVFACVRQPSQGPTFGIKGELWLNQVFALRFQGIKTAPCLFFNPVFRPECVVLFSVCRWRCGWRIFSSHSYGRGTREKLCCLYGKLAAWLMLMLFLVQPSSHWGHSCHHGCQQSGGGSHRRSHVPRVNTIWQGGGLGLLVKLDLDVLPDS